MPTPIETLPEKEPKYFHSEVLEFQLVARAAEGEAAKPAEEEIWAVMSTETPCATWFGTEVLSHEKSAIDMGIARHGLSMYIEHGGWPYRPTPDPAQHIGIVDPVELRADRKLWGRLQFSQHPLAQQTKQSVLDRTLRFGSIKALTSKRKVTRAPANMGEQRDDLVTRWRPEEFSIVGIPADPNSQVARSAAGDLHPVEYEFEAPATTTQEETPMPPTEVTPAAAPASQAADPAAAAPVAVARSAGAAVTVNENAATADELMALCDSHGVTVARARQFLQQGVSLSQAKSVLFDERSKPASRQPGAEVRVEGLAQKDRSRYSVRRALLQAVNVAEGRGQFDGVEGEVHTEIARNTPSDYKGIGGFFVPLELTTEDERQERRERIARAMGTGVAGGGAELVFDFPRDLLDVLRNRMLCAQFGAEILTGLVGNVPFPVQTGDPTAYFIGENPANAAADSQMTFTTRTLGAKESVAVVPFPRRLLNVASFNIEQRARISLIAKHARLWDNMALHGRGTDGEPTGIYNVPGVGSVAFGGAPTFAKLVDMEFAVVDANVDSQTMAYMTTPPQAGKMKQTPVIAGAAAGMIWTGRGADGEVNGYRAGATKQVNRTLGAGANEHGLIFGDWSALTFGYWGALEFIVDQVTLAGKGQIKITTNQMGDSVVTRPEAFAVGTGVV